ncbi:hypothetical protein PM082_022536 [Marasmius tenuissimus]|nr:hypothetical protein PM082_022536 [Marasmius tenuissimus]
MSNPKCTLALFIAAVELVTLDYPYCSSESPSPPSLQIHEIIRSIIRGCKSLKSLKLNGTHRTVFLPFTRLSSSLTHLELVDYLPDEGPQSSIMAGTVLDLIGNFKVLEVLKMHFDAHDLWVMDPVEPVCDLALVRRSSLESSLPCLRRLQLDLMWNVFLPWFLIPGILGVPDLKTLALNLAYLPLPPPVPLLQSFIDLYSPSLESLVVYVMWETLPSLDLSRFGLLRSILFRVRRPPKAAGEFKKLIDVVSTAINRGHRESVPLRVIITHGEAELVAQIEGVRWILDARYYNEEYEWS